jgi:hypothetical protein
LQPIALAFAILFPLAGLSGVEAQDSSDLVGHWRKTTIRFEEPRDEHLVLGADGRMSNWVVTADSQSQPVVGGWSAGNGMLSLDVDGGGSVTQPYTFYEGKLVFPNIPNRRGFWERLED